MCQLKLKANISYIQDGEWNCCILPRTINSHSDDVIKWKHFPRYWPFVRGIHRSPVNSPHKGMWHGTLMFSLIYARINGWVNNRKSVDLRRHRTHYDVNVMTQMAIVAHIHNVRNPRWEIWYFHGKYAAVATSYCAYRLTIHYFHNFTDFKYIFTALTLFNMT